MSHRRNAVAAGMFLAMFSVAVPYAQAQDPPDVDKSADFKRPFDVGPQPPQVMRFEVDGHTAKVAKSGSRLTISYELMESDGNLPLRGRLVAKVEGQPDVPVPGTDIDMDTPMYTGTAEYVVPDVSQPTNVALVWELTNSVDLALDPTSNTTFLFIAQPAGMTFPAGSPTEPAPGTPSPAPPPPAPEPGAADTAAVTTDNQPPALSLTLTPQSVKGGPGVTVKLTCMGTDPEGDPLTYSIRVVGGDPLTPGPVPNNEFRIPVENEEPVETRLQLEVTALDSRGGQTVSTIDLVILPSAPAPTAAAPPAPAPSPAAPFVTRPVNGARPYTVRVSANRPRNRLPVATRSEDPNTGEWIITVPPQGSLTRDDE